LSTQKTAYLLFGAAAGLAATAAAIGLLLVGTAVVIHLQAEVPSVLTQHTLFISGSELVSRALTAALPLFAIWYFWRKA
jgi:hypothetical protein